MTPPKLQPPGAGLPFFSRLAIRGLGRFMLRRKFTWDTAPASVEATALRGSEQGERRSQRTRRRARVAEEDVRFTRDQPSSESGNARRIHVLRHTAAE